MTNIKIDTVHNGYIVDIDGEDYMYYSVDALIKGLVIRVAMKERSSMITTDKIDKVFDFLSTVNPTDVLSQVAYIERTESMEKSIRYHKKCVGSLERKIEKLESYIKDIEKDNLKYLRALNSASVTKSPQR